MKKFSIVAKDDQESLLIAKDIRKRLFHGEMSYSEKEPDIVCVIGGDGTFLAAVHKYVNILDKTVFVGINTGTLGFFIDYTVDEIDNYINDILYKEPEIERHRLLKATVVSDRIRSFLAVNEVRIDNMVRTQNIEVLVNGNKLEDFRGSGLCISTQSGSTAYNRAINGAVVERGLEIMQLAEIAGVHNIHYRSLGAPLILSGENVITLNSDYDETSLLCFDRYAINLKGVSSVEVTLTQESFKLARYNEVNYIKKFSQLF